ncbi:MAG TPA: ferredoxin, partial [Ramlibacter sp.]|nr:ferredoxin [Ramlibacter sp.]
RVAPQLFQLDAAGCASARIAIVPVELEELAELAAENCPECAIAIERVHEAAPPAAPVSQPG